MHYICSLDEKWQEIWPFYGVSISLMIISWLPDVSRRVTNALEEESDAFWKANSLFPNTISSNLLMSIGLEISPLIPAANKSSSYTYVCMYE